MKLGFYLLEGPSVSFLDFVCYSGYKYVSIVACALVKLNLYLKLKLNPVCCSGYKYVSIVACALVKLHPTPKPKPTPYHSKPDPPP